MPDNHHDDLELGLRLRALRERAGLSRRALAKRAEVTKCPCGRSAPKNA